MLIIVGVHFLVGL